MNAAQVPAALPMKMDAFLSAMADRRARSTPVLKLFEVVPAPPDVAIDAAVRGYVERLARLEPAALDDGTLYDRVLAEVERPLIEAMLARHGGNQLRAARAIGLNRNTLRKRLDTLGIEPAPRPPAREMR